MLTKQIGEDDEKILKEIQLRYIRSCHTWNCRDCIFSRSNQLLCWFTMYVIISNGNREFGFNQSELMIKKHYDGEQTRISVDCDPREDGITITLPIYVIEQFTDYKILTGDDYGYQR